MPVVMVNGSPYSAIEKVTVAKAQPLPMEVKPSPVANSVKQPSSAVPVLAAEKAEPKIQQDSAIKKVTVAQVQPLPKEVKPSPVASNTSQPNHAVPVLATGKSESEAHQATPSRVIRTTAIPKERQFKLEVSNGNGIHRLASRISSMLSARGLPKASVSNHASFNQARTVIHYRKGYRFEAARLSRNLRGTRQAIMMVESRHLPAKTDVRLVLGKDLSGKLNWMDKARPMTLASR